MAFNLADVLKDVSDSGTGREQIEYISLSLIDEDPNNFYQLTDIPLLADNISLCGLQQPIRVRQKKDGRYIIVSGHRRRAALDMLVADGYEQWKEAPCIVERDSISPTLQQLRLIYANANTRKMSNAELGEQAEQVEKLLYQLKEEGYDFPGRMRDHVAEAVGASKSKLARLKVIRENLAVCWADAYKDGTLTESQAYALAQMPQFWQSIIKDNWKYAVQSLYADTIARIRGRFQKVTTIQCQHGLQLCEHSAAMMEKNSKESWNAPCTGCCFDCSSLQTCKNCCPEAKGKQKEMKAVAKKANLDAKVAQEERDRPGTEFARLVWSRVGLARKQNGVSVEAIMKARGENFYNESYDDPKQQKMENGEGCYTPHSLVSMGYEVTAANLMRVVAVADALHCSVDYLLGRTERMELVTNPKSEENVSDSGIGWKVGTPSSLGEYIVLVKFSKISRLTHQKMTWNGSGWEVRGEQFEFDDAQITYWIPMPQVLEEPKPTTNESCITGMSPSGHCAAAACCANEYTCCLQCPEQCNIRCGWIDDIAEEI